MRVDKRELASEDKLLSALPMVQAFGTAILFDFAKRELDLKGKITRNFLARGNYALKSIDALWRVGAYQDCWMIFRCVLERVFHLHDLIRKNNFAEFDNWSLIKQFEAQSALRSDRELSPNLTDEFLMHNTSLRLRYDKLKKMTVKYKHPDPKSVAQDMDLLVLYKYGYDFASTQIHPRANDGEEAFLRQIGDTKHERHMDHTAVLQNTILAWKLLMEEALKANDRQWRRIIQRFMDDVATFLETGSEDYKQTFVEFANLGPDQSLSIER